MESSWLFLKRLTSEITARRALTWNGHMAQIFAISPSFRGTRSYDVWQLQWAVTECCIIGERLDMNRKDYSHSIASETRAYVSPVPSSCLDKK